MKQLKKIWDMLGKQKLLIFIFIFALNVTLRNYDLLIGRRANSSLSFKVISKNFDIMIEHWEALPSHFKIIGGVCLVIYVLSILGLSFYLSKNLKKTFFIELLLGYGLYIVISYFLAVTRELNNESFKIWDLAKNHFFQPYFLPTLVLIIVCTLALNYLIRVKMKRSHLSRKMTLLLENFSETEFLLTGLIVSFILSDTHYVKLLQESLRAYYHKPLAYESLLFLYTLLTLILFSVIVEACFNAYRSIKLNRPNLSLAFVSSLLFATIFNYAFQYGLKNDADLLGKYIVPGATAYQILVLTAAGFFLYLIINRYLLVTFLIVILGSIITVVNVLKVGMRNEPLLVTDFAWVTNIRLLARSVNANIIFSCSDSVIFVP